MVDVALRNNNVTTGTTSPATSGSGFSTATGNLVLFFVHAVGANLTFSTPSNWIKIQSQESQTPLGEAMFALFNPSSGTKNPTSTIGGTVTGWITVLLELTNTGALCALVDSHSEQENNQTSFDSCMRMYVNESIPNLVWVHSISLQGSAGIPAVYTPQPWNRFSTTTGNGLSVNNFWWSNQNFGPWPGPTTRVDFGSTSVVGQQMSAAFTTSASQFGPGSTIGGQSGKMVEQFYQGTIGG